MNTLSSQQGTFDLLADIGGTNSRIALAKDGEILPDTVHRLRNKDHEGFDAVLASYFKMQEMPQITNAAVAIAGPVEGSSGTMTNLDWHVSSERISRLTGAENAHVLNDLQAQCYGIDRIDAANIIPIVTGRPAANGATRLAVGLGTGFNATPIFCQNQTLFVPPSETGHADLPTQGKTENALATYLRNGENRATLEDLLSGQGLAQAYGFFAKIPKGSAIPEPAWVIDAAQKGADTSADQAVHYFVRLLARSVADLALIHLPFGGVYLVGGVARAITPFLAKHDFQSIFLNKGRLSPLMASFPISLIENDFAALHGCLQTIEQARG